MTSDSAMKASPSIFPGATISGRFRIDRLLGRGSMGSVWRARHLALDVDVAVKFIDAALRDERDHRVRFVREAQSAARIASPHVVNVLDFGEDEGRLYIAMEYLDGEDLGRFLARNGRLSLDVTARIVAHTCRGLQRAHALGIAHRDIKPENLFLCGGADDDGFVLKILDFGVAKSAQTVESFTGTSAGQLIGSPAYMSPEQARGLRQLDGRSDLFSLAVVAYHCLTGRTPFLGDSLADLLFGIIGSDPEPVTMRATGLPKTLDGWFERALQKDPERRFPSAKEAAQAFELAVGQRGSFGPDYTTSPRLTLTGASGLGDTVISRSSSTRVTVPSPSASNRSGLASLPGVLAQLADVGNVLGAGLVSPELVPLAHHSSRGLAAGLFAKVAERVRDALAVFEDVEAVEGRVLALYFQSATLLVRWIEDYALIVIGTEQVHPSVLTVSLNSAASRLQLAAEQAGGAARAFALEGQAPPAQPVPQAVPPLASAQMLPSVQALPSAQALPTPQVPQASPARERDSRPAPTPAAVISAAPELVSEATLQQLSRELSTLAGPLGRLALQQRLKGKRPTPAGYFQLVTEVAPVIEDPLRRASFIETAFDLVPAARAAAPAAEPAPKPVEPPAAPPKPTTHLGERTYRGVKVRPEKK